MHKFNLFRFKNFFNPRTVFLATVPIITYNNYFKNIYQCWWFGTKYQRNKLDNRVETIQYNANNPIEDRISYRNLQYANGYAALVLDGHGGWQIAQYVNNNLINTLDAMLLKNQGIYGDQQTFIVNSIKEAFDDVQNKALQFAKQSYKFGMPQIVKIGACALLVLVVNNKVYAANAGDSQGLLISQNNGRFDFEKLNKKLNANSKKQRKRLQQLFPDEKDIVICKRDDGSACYVKGRLQPTRSFGDFRLKWKQFNTLKVSQSIAAYKEGPYITHEPQIRVFPLQKKHKYIVIGCDGLWDEMTKGEVTHVIKKNFGKNIPQILLNQSLFRAAKSKRMDVQTLKKKEAGKQRRGIHDDISIIGIKLQSQIQ